MSQDKEKHIPANWVLSALIEMIDETLYHTQTFAHALRSHNNEQAASVFFLACEQFETEKEIVAEHTQNDGLPSIPPWEMPFPEYQHPSSHLTEAHYLMTENEARKATERLIGAHQTFYATLLKENREEQVIRCVEVLVRHHEVWK
ncbi:MAG TPA: hypothetical protein VIM88_03075 [Sulfurovum sp.]|uniref:hypothetical protein n=1 Tax=Sulfurovum sp. TaxID=1969726 RepID=UPI002F91E2FA